jgi:hypothetical protein
MNWGPILTSYGFVSFGVVPICVGILSIILGAKLKRARDQLPQPAASP